MDWARILTYVTGTVDQELLAGNELLATENRILKDQLKGRQLLSDAERATLGEIGLAWVARFSPEVATVALPDTILAWYRKLVARKFSGSHARQGPGRPRLKRGGPARASEGANGPSRVRIANPTPVFPQKGGAITAAPSFSASTLPSSQPLFERPSDD
jgi:hypothetical protein